MHVLSWKKVISSYSASKFSVIILFIQRLIPILKEKYLKSRNFNISQLSKVSIKVDWALPITGNCHIRPFVIKFLNLLYLSSVMSLSCFVVESFVLLVHGNRQLIFTSWIYCKFLILPEYLILGSRLFA